MTETVNFGKLNGLVPAIVQDSMSRQVLMVGFMNKEALEKTLADETVTFWSRSKARLWQKGETSGNILRVVSVQVDCDQDALLIQAVPEGPVCHTGTFTCFGEERALPADSVLGQLENIIRGRKTAAPESSYTAKLFQQGTARIAQKVGEEAIETVVAALDRNAGSLKDEAADLLYHLIVLLVDRGMSLADVDGVLEQRMGKSTKS